MRIRDREESLILWSGWCS